MADMEDKIIFQKRKKSLLLNCMDTQFFDSIYEDLSAKNFETMEELDEWLEKELIEHDRQIAMITAFYDEKIDKILNS